MCLDIVISFGTAGGVTEKSKSEYGMGPKLENDPNIDTKSDDEPTESAQDSNDDALKKKPSAPIDHLGHGLSIHKSSNSTDEMVSVVKIGDVVLGEACLFLDRLRTRNKKAFDWGIHSLSHFCSA